MAVKWDSTFWSMRETFYFACKGVLKNISKSAKKTKLSFWFLSFFKISTFSSSFYRKCGKNTQKWFCSHRFRWFLLVTRKPPRRFRETLVTRNRAASLWEFLSLFTLYNTMSRTKQKHWPPPSTACIVGSVNIVWSDTKIDRTTHSPLGASYVNVLKHH